MKRVLYCGGRQVGRTWIFRQNLLTQFMAGHIPRDSMVEIVSYRGTEIKSAREWLIQWFPTLKDRID